MSAKMPRRACLKAAPVAAYALSQAVRADAPLPVATAAPLKLEPFNYRGVTLRASPWQKQYQSARDFYLGVSNDDILHGYRAAAGLPAPGNALSGWCAANSNTVFGQWLSGLSRMACAGDDQALRDKVAYLFTEWTKTVQPDGNCAIFTRSGLGHYPYEKLICGLVDMQLYGGFPDTSVMMVKVTDYAIKNLRRDRIPAAPRPWPLHSGTPLEWYTVGENLYRAFQLTGNSKYKDFAEVWHYTPYWNKFAGTPAPGDAWGVHAYSHLNSFSTPPFPNSSSRRKRQETSSPPVTAGRWTCRIFGCPSK